jgi:cobalt-zinc-cadmium efflux system outer membrane protein
MFRASTFVAALCVLPIAAGRAQAQTPSAPVPLTIDQAIAEAIDRNLAVVAERYNIAVADARIVTAGLRPNPVITASAMLPDSTIYDASINPREGIVRGDVLIERGGKRDRRLEVAQDAKAVSELQLQNTIRALVLNVQSAFVDIQQAEAELTLARESLSAFNEIVGINAERVRSGDLAAVELQRSRLAALQFQNDVRIRDARLATAIHRLRVLLGRTDTAPIAAVGELRHDGAALQLDALQQRALQLRPDLKALERDQARSAADARLQVAQGTIDYTVSAEFHRQLAPGGLAGNEWGLFFSAPLPIFSRNQGEIERARREETQLGARVDALRAQIANEVQVAYDQYVTSRSQVDRIEREMLQQARDVRDTTEYSYRRGEASFVEFLDAQRAYNETMQSYNDARADHARNLYLIDSVSARGINP